MIRFLRKLSEPLKYGALIIAGGLYIWAIIFLLKSDNWVGISALTTMLLAIAAFWVIRQNYELHKRERRERLLNEIIEWAAGVANIGFEESIISLPEAGDSGVDEYDMQRMTLSKLSSVYSTCKALDSRSKYISFISQNLSKELHKYVSNVSFRIDNLEKSLAKSIKEDKGISIPKGDELIKVRTSAHNLIEEATKIKTRDIA